MSAYLAEQHRAAREIIQVLLNDIDIRFINNDLYLALKLNDKTIQKKVEIDPEILREFKDNVYLLGGLNKMKVTWYKLKRLNGSVLFLQSQANMLQYIKEHDIKVKEQKDNWYIEIN